MTMIEENRQQRKDIESKTIEMLCNNQCSATISLTDLASEKLQLGKVVPPFNKSNMDVDGILSFIISTIGVSGSSFNALFDNSVIAKKAGFCKATFYNALKKPSIDWSGMSRSIALTTAERLFHGKKVWFVIDDSIIKRNCSQTVELLARVYDHNEDTFHKGFTLLTLGLTDGKDILPISFTLLSSPQEENIITKVNHEGKSRTKAINYATKAGRNRKKACQNKMDVLIEMLKTAKSAISTKKFQIAGVLADSWFSAPAQVKRFVDLGLHVVTQLKFNNTNYTTVDGNNITIKEEADKIKQEIEQGQSFGDIAKEYVVDLKGSKGKIIFAKNWTKSAKKKPYIALFCTDIEYSGEQIQKYYKRRWLIEVMFKRLKSILALQTCNNTRIFESNVALISITFIRYSVIHLMQKVFKDKGLRLTFRGVIRKFEEELRYTDTTKDLAVSLSSVKEVADNLTLGFTTLVNECHLPISQAAIFRASLYVLDKNVLHTSVSETFYKLTPENQTRLCNYIVNGNVASEVQFR